MAASEGQGGTPGRGQRRRSRPLLGALLALAPLLALFVGEGCEAVVPGTVGSYRCGSVDPSSCPPGQVCVVATGKCVDSCLTAGCSPSEACDPASGLCEPLASPTDASDARPNPDGTPPPRDVTSDVMVEEEAAPPPDVQIDAACGGVVGCACAGPNTCKAGLVCADTSVVPGLTSAGFFCTQPCCTSDDCPTDYVCYSTGAPANYCVAARLLNRAFTGGPGAAGATCPGDSACRSGKCTSGHCQDPCCSNASCTGGTACALDTTAVDGHQGFFCLAGTGSGGSGVFCVVNGDCASEACSSGGSCLPRCCGKASCTGAGFQACELFGAPNNTDNVAACNYVSGGSTKGYGQPCAQPSDCASTVCDVQAKTCTDVCCVDTDCAGYGVGLVCRPSMDMPRYLICMKGP